MLAPLADTMVHPRSAKNPYLSVRLLLLSDIIHIGGNVKRIIMKIYSNSFLISPKGLFFVVQKQIGKEISLMNFSPPVLNMPG